LNKNGQIHELTRVVYFTDKQLVLVLTSIEKNSLSNKHENINVREFRINVEKMCGSKFKAKLLG